MRFLVLFATFLGVVAAQSDKPWLQLEGGSGPGVGKKVVLISGDEEYRSEEALTQLGKILSARHGFDATVLFAVDPESGSINPHVRTNIPGLEALDDANLMVIFTRWRTLPDEQMAYIDGYLKAGKPVIAMRTATHAFAAPDAAHKKVRAYSRVLRDDPDAKPPEVSAAEWGNYGQYGDGYFGPRKAWKDGFGRLVVGEMWVAHHGRHKHESTLGVFAEGAADHPILRGIRDKTIWGATDVYRVRLPLPGDSKPLVFGEVLARKGEFDDADADYGMRPDDGPPVAEKNDPMMPVAWTKSYKIPGGAQGRVFSTTMGSATDLNNEGVRRMLVNAAYWALGMEDSIPDSGSAVGIVGRYEPSRFENLPPEHWKTLALKPADFQ